MEKSTAEGCQRATDRQVLLEQLPAFTLLKLLLPKLQGLSFGVGGSLLLCELGLLSQARDLDLVCVAADFAHISSVLSRTLRPVEVAPHPYYQSRCFACFVAADGTQLDLMADIAVLAAGQRICWSFDQSKLQVRQGIPWMSAGQWLELYRLFQRPERVALLQQWAG